MRKKLHRNRQTGQTGPYCISCRSSLCIATCLVLAGFVLMLFPCDRFDPVHSTGGSLVSLGLWVINTMMLVRLNEIFESFI